MSTAPVLQTSLSDLKLVRRGKVRDVYAVDDDSLLIVATDRISAFDCILPTPIARSLLRRLVPGSEGVLGFKAHYDRTSYRQFSRMAERTGFEVLRCSCSYYSSVYFRFFLPLYLASLLLDHLRHALAVKSLASFYLFILEKPAAASAPEVTRDGF